MKIFKIAIILILSSGLFFLVFSYADIQNLQSLYEIVFTYLSITIGFTITSIAIIATSSYSKALYDRQDPRDNSKTLLHNLVDRLKFTLIYFTIPMVIILVFALFPWPATRPKLRDFFDSLLVILIFWSFPVLIQQFKTILNFILQNAKRLEK